MNIREATIDDAKGLLYHVKAVLGSSPFTLTTLDEFKQSEDTQLEMKQQKNLILVEEDNGRIIGDLIFLEEAKIEIHILVIQKKPCAETVWHYNTVVMGIQNYNAAATQISNNLSELSSHLNKTLYNRLKNIRTEAKFTDLTSTLQKLYKGYEPRFFKIQQI